MADKTWYIHSQGVTFGPLPTKVVKVMLEQGRVQVTEFVWTPGVSHWERIRDRFEFSGEQLPPYPEEAIPEDGSAPASDDDEPEPAPKPKAAAKPAPVAAPKAAPAPAPAPVHTHAPKPTIKASSKAAAKTAAVAKEAHHEHAAPAEKPQLKVVAEKAAPQVEAQIRRSPRVLIRGHIKVEGQGNYDIADISETGILIRCPKSMAPGSHLDFLIESDELEKSPLPMTGVVARSLFVQGKDCVAIEFIRVNPAHKRILQALVAEKTEKGQVVTA